MRTRWTIAGIAAGVIIGVVTWIIYQLQTDGSTIDTVSNVILYLLSTVLTGYAYSWLTRTGAERLPLHESLPVGILCGGLAWVFFGLIVIPGLTGLGVQWNAEEAANQFPLLIIYLLYGILLSVSLHMVKLVGWLESINESPQPDEADTSAQHRIVILGGGFAGVTTAQTLEKRLGNETHVQITLVSLSNHLLFTPMMAEVTAGGVEAQHIAPPLRAFFRNVKVIQGEPIDIRASENRVIVQSGQGIISELPYDHLVFAVGSVPNYFGNVNLERYSMAFKSLADTIRIRTHIIEMLEKADSESDAEQRQSMLTFVVVGAGFAGSELIGGLNDFVRGSLWYYSNIHNEEITMLLVHPGDRILMELSEDLARYAEEKMIARGVTIQSGKRVTDAGPDTVTIGDKTIRIGTLIWTAGNVPNPVLQMVGAETNKRGALVTDETLLVEGTANMWAVGDCAAVPDVITGGTAPPTAQYALREAKTLGHNLYAVIQGDKPKAFRHRSQGALAVVGHQTACAEVFGVKFSGLFAWLLWRGIYLTKLPTLEKKVRVLLDWIIDVFFPRDIAYAPLTDEMTQQKQQKQPTTGD